MASASEADRHGVARCGGKKKQGGGTCTQPAGWGTDHPGVGRCKLHGGCTPNQVAAAGRELLERRARMLFEKVAPEIVPVDNPLEAYRMFAGRVMAWLGLMEQLLADLESPRYRGQTAEQIRGEVLLYERAMDRANAVLGTYAKLNIDERLARISEEQGKLLYAAVMAGLQDARLSAEQLDVARRGIARELRLVAAAERGEAG